MDNKHLRILQIGFNCPDPACKLARHHCINCAYKHIRERFNDVSIDLDQTKPLDQETMNDFEEAEEAAMEHIGSVPEIIEEILGAPETGFVYNNLQLEVEIDDEDI